MAASSPTPEQVEVAELLARRAAGDLKVALTLNGADFPKTHDLEFLIGLASRQILTVPDDIAGAGWLTPWAADFRYDDEPLDSLDRDSAVSVAGSAVAWCEELLAVAQPDDANPDR